MTKQEITVNIPACWRELVDIVFDEGLTYKGKPVTSEKNCKSNADPEPHYDDARCVSAKVGDVMVTIDLCSGQSNYYAGCTIESNNDVVYEETWGGLDELNECDGTDGILYIVKLDFID